MTSRSATVLVIFVIAIFAFCLASVFAAMTGPISILPNESESGGILDNLSAFTDDDTSESSYGYQDYSNYDYSDSSDDSNVETTTEDTSSSSTSSSSVETTTADAPQSSSSGSNSGSNGGGSSSGGSSSANVETTVDNTQ